MVVPVSGRAVMMSSGLGSHELGMPAAAAAAAAEAEESWTGLLSPVVYVIDTAAAVSVFHLLVAVAEKLLLLAPVCMFCGAPGVSEPGAHETLSDGLEASVLAPQGVLSCSGWGRGRNSLVQGMLTSFPSCSLTVYGCCGLGVVIPAQDGKYGSNQSTNFRVSGMMRRLDIW